MDYDQRSTTEIKPEPRWGAEEDSRARPTETYRRRSPGPHDRRSVRGPPRRRSRSPIGVDQYRPGDRPPRDDYYGRSRDFPPRDREDRRRPPSPPVIDRYVPGQEPLPMPIRTNPMPNPLSLEYQVGFNFFAEWWRIEQQIKEDKERAETGRRPPPKTNSPEEREKERAQIQIGYDAYKEELQAKMAKTFVFMHKGQEWFKERYLHEIRDPFRKRLMEFRTGALGRWKEDLDNGLFDDFTLEGIYKAESNGVGGIIEREEGETVAAAEILGVGDLVPSRGGDIRDESAQQPALLIKTLAPMVSREKIEAFCNQYLGEGDGGFKWLSLSDPNPQKKCHRIGWIMLHPSAEVDAPMEERKDAREDEGGMDEDEPQPELKSSLLNTAEKALDAINGKTIVDEARGDFTCHVGVHVPAREPRKKALWDLFSAPERVERDLQLAKRMVDRFDEDSSHENSAIERVETRVEQLRNDGTLRAQFEATNGAKKPIKAKSTNGDAMDEDVEDGEEEGEELEDGEDDEEIDDDDLLAQKKTLDLLVEYLRRVYNFCFFCVFESDSVHELVRKCPGGHLRRPRASLSTAAKAAARASALGEKFQVSKQRRESNADEVMAGSPIEEKRFNRGGSKNDQQLQRAFNWVRTFEEKLMQILEPEGVDLRKLGGVPLEEGLDEELKKFVKQEDDSKFRCKVPDCTKLFKGETFWRKHVEKRHDEWYNTIKNDLILVNTYVLDPAHIAPSRSDANSNGHFPQSNNYMQTGTPRGFSLQNMQQPGMPMPGPYGQVPGGFAGVPSLGSHMVQMPNGMVTANPMMMGDGSMHHPGPMRRGRGRAGFSHQPAGPYDRRQPRYGGPPVGMGAGTGRLSPPRGAMGMTAGSMMRMGTGKWGDGMGAMAVGPKEAVQGRSLKSYEDLDAVAGAGGGELNY